MDRITTSATRKNMPSRGRKATAFGVGKACALIAFLSFQHDLTAQQVQALRLLRSSYSSGWRQRNLEPSFIRERSLIANLRAVSSPPGAQSQEQKEDEKRNRDHATSNRESKEEQEATPTASSTSAAVDNQHSQSFYHHQKYSKNFFTTSFNLDNQKNLQNLQQLTSGAKNKENTEKTTSPDLNACLLALLDKTYEDLSGYDIPVEEHQALRKVGGEPTYGEIVPSSLTQVLLRMNATEADVFYDLGSGIGKTVLQAALTTRVKQAIGIEFENTRNLNALTAKQKLLAELEKTMEATGRNLRQDFSPACGGVADDELKDFLEEIVAGAHSSNKEKSLDSRIQLIQNDFAHIDLTNATLIYSCSTCFSENLLAQICTNIGDLGTGKSNLRVFASLKSLDTVPACMAKLEEEAVMALPMTWTQEANVYFYRLKK
ncbi:unnamed protein product [Amoebophrya sp. A120]|nr:unnamed protein product [Amoebophrya sp. A120]|eukprot:GSA120T00007492001.1